MKRFLVLIPAACFVLLAGCASADVQGDIQREIDKALVEDMDYNNYKQWDEQGLLDVDGKHLPQELPVSEQEPQGDIYVTFASNNNLQDICYYYDKELTKPIDGSYCYLNAGDTIYAKQPEVKSSVSRIYSFSGYRVWDYNSDGTRDDSIDVDGSGNVVYEIPTGFSGTELSVEPLCECRTRTLTFAVDAIDENGISQQQEGTWLLVGNNKRQVNDHAEISGLESVSLQYEYDANKFFCTGTSPEASSIDEATGIVYFTTDITKEVDDYSVQLRSYINGYISSDDDKAVTSVIVNGEGRYFTKLHDMDIPRLKYGDKISITTTEEYKVLCDGVSIPEPKKSGGYTFTIIVPENVSELRISTKEWATKRVMFTMPEKGFWQSVGEWFHDIVKTAEQDKLFTVSCGENGSGGTYNFEDLKYANTGIELKESDKLTISVSEEIKNFPNIAFSISVNGAAPVAICGSTPKKSVSYSFAAVDKVKVDVLHGYVFSYKNINNGDIKMKYTVDGKPIEEGQFLPVGSVVHALAERVPDNYVITGGAVDVTFLFGDITITEKTGIADFNVRYEIRNN